MRILNLSNKWYEYILKDNMHEKKYCIGLPAIHVISLFYVWHYKETKKKKNEMQTMQQ